MLSFVVIRFFSLSLGAARSLLLAAILGPQSYGALGTLILVQQYLSYAALGMREGVTVSLARAQASSTEVPQIYASALAWGAGVGLALWAALAIAHVLLGGAGAYLVWLGPIVLLGILNEILININRDRNRLKTIAALEVLYNAVPLGVALWLWKDTTIAAVLASLAVGLLTSVTIYVATLPRVGVRDLQWRVAKELLAIGFPLSALSGVTLLANSVYIILANRMSLGHTLGLVVFANTACTLVLFALNTVAWGATGRSMRHAYAGTASSQAEQLRAERLRTAFRLGCAVAALVCLSTAWVFMVVLKGYAGAEVFAFYFCLLQAYGLLLFDEINHLTVTGRSRWVIAGYGALLVLVCGWHFVFPEAGITTLMIVGIVGYFLLALAAVRYCETLSPLGIRDRSKMIFLLFPVLCALLYAGVGSAAAVSACIAFAAIALWSHHARRAAWQ